MDKEEARDRVAAAIANSKYRWRTATGVAKDSGVSYPQVLETLERSDYFVKSQKGNARGEALYTTTEKYKASCSLRDRMLSAIANKRIR